MAGEQRALGSPEALAAGQEDIRSLEVEKRLREHIYFASTQFHPVPTLCPPTSSDEEQRSSTVDRKDPSSSQSFSSLGVCLLGTRHCAKHFPRLTQEILATLWMSLTHFAFEETGGQNI